MNRIALTAVIAVSQLALVGVGVAPQLSARLIGDTYLMNVAPLDPVDPLRGAYVSLDYPDLRQDAPDSSGTPGPGALDDGEEGEVYVSLAQQGDVWVADGWSRQRPSAGPYLACDDRWSQIRCGIESYFLPQDDAAATADLLRAGAVAEVRIDGRGNAAVVGVRAP